MMPSQLAAAYKVIITRKNNVWIAKSGDLVVATGINLTILHMRLKLSTSN